LILHISEISLDLSHNYRITTF